MRKRFRVLFLAVLVAAFVVPVGFALSLEPAPPVSAHHAPAATPAVSLTALVVNTSIASHSMPDSAKLVLVGTMLFGLAAAVRKAV